MAKKKTAKKTVARADESPEVQSPTAPVEAAQPSEAAQPQPATAPVEKATGVEASQQEPTPATSPEKPSSHTVYDPKGNPHRTYSRDVHGPEFEKLAHQYVSSRPGWSVR